VQSIRKTFVQTIEPAKDALSTELEGQIEELAAGVAELRAAKGRGET